MGWSGLLLLRDHDGGHIPDILVLDVEPPLHVDISDIRTLDLDPKLGCHEIGCASASFSS
jgi:hypothetical protein